MNTLDRRYGRWTVLNPEHHHGLTVMCVCECGTRREVRKDGLVGGTSRSCGCLRREKLEGVGFPDLTDGSDTEVVPGARFGRWTVAGEIEPSSRYGAKNRMVLCECDCGNQRKVVVTHLLNNRTKSCGCLKRDGNAARHLVEKR